MAEVNSARKITHISSSENKSLGTPRFKTLGSTNQTAMGGFVSQQEAIKIDVDDYSPDPIKEDNTVEEFTQIEGS